MHSSTSRYFSAMNLTEACAFRRSMRVDFAEVKMILRGAYLVKLKMLPVSLRIVMVEVMNIMAQVMRDMMGIMNDPQGIGESKEKDEDKFSGQHCQDLVL